MISSFTEGSGGGTPEDMVWENVTADRVTDNTYTNDNDVPLYVQIDTLEGANGANFAFEIDGNRMGKIGTKDSQSSLFVVPSKATYRLIKMVAEGVVENWNEARMPLAISGGSGGGSYTPETFVWEDRKLERDFATYTNDWDVPRYVEIGITGLGDTDYAYANFLIDGKYHASLGKQGLNTRDMSQGMFIVLLVALIL